VFGSLLVANRGEIACRVMRTARGMGIRTIAVYSEADARALHVRSADVAVCIGPAPARESYLDIGRVLGAAREAGAEAIHPGYGFLSESADFAEACQESGLVFVGPPAASIRAMGSKSAAKARMLEAGVPLLPGYHGAGQEGAQLAAEAARIGFPVLIKAVAGGGGKGMRRVDGADGFAAALASCQREALSSFGNGDVLVEKYVVGPRHVEVQVFCDAHGNAVHLFERDCSVQRRHQKVLEEAPAPGMTPERRERMGRAAVDAARAVGYVGAGTVEFLCAGADPDHFWFMEMNTRLQVEHPVTEMITGLDLVEWQLRVAAGERLPATQDTLRIHGHAIEARIYAEDPDHGFLPQSGRLAYLRPPPGARDLRLDAGVAQGDAIGTHYDPMIGKLIAWGEDREQARVRLRDALRDFRIAGVGNNLSFLARLVDTPSFAQARLDTDLIEREAAHLLPRALPRDAVLLAALAEIAHERAREPASGSAWAARDGWRLNQDCGRRLEFTSGGSRLELRVRVHAGSIDIAFAGTPSRCTIESPGGGDDPAALQARIDGRAVAGAAVRLDGAWHLFLGGGAWRLGLSGEEASASAMDGAAASLAAPMHGKVVALLAREGEAVAAGAPLLVMEAMKMEHAVLAPSAGVVRAFLVAAGQQVAGGTLLVDFVPAP
jgi:3-methylcrotonyl-CoA carboxylase alpha subunit